MVQELTLTEVYEGLAGRMDHITNEVVKANKAVSHLSTRMLSLEDTFKEVELRNGGDHLTKVPYKQFMQDLYDFNKPGGVLEQKMAECKESHSPTKNLEKMGKKWDVYWKWGQRIVAAILVVWMIFKILDIDNVVKTNKSTVDTVLNETRANN